MERLQVLVALKRRNRFLNLSVPAYAIYLGIAGLVAILVCGSLLGSFAVARLTDSERAGRLARENDLLKAKVAAYAAAMDTFRQFMVAAEQMDNKLRASISLPLIPGDIRLMGIGGSQPSSPEPRVDAMLRRVRFEQQSLSEIQAALKEQESRLQYVPSIWPVQGWVASGFGYRTDPFTGKRAMHPGLDIVAPTGTPVAATGAGRVVYAGWKPGWGRCVEIDHGGGIRTFYAHCRSLKVNGGQKVSRGDVIASVGNSGRSTGTHLHYGVLANGNWVNPGNYVLAQLSAN
ncbi:M23 family metallopeptidase [candidate division WOR-3 bacterium]|nr:M23 family metallopeptidase [candidate division WOR-3 bacterium]